MLQLPECPIETTLLFLGNRWIPLILRELLTGTKRFGELKKSLNGISQKVLTTHLRTMEAQQLLTRTVYAEIPPRVEYTLTETGKSLSPVIRSMHEWGIKYKEEKSWQTGTSADAE